MTDIKQREISWTRCDDEWQFTIFIDSKKYCISVTPETRQEVMRDVGLCAADPTTNMTLVDCVEINAKIRELVPIPWIEFYPEEYQHSDVGMLICMTLPGMVFWILVTAGGVWLYLY